VGEGEEERGGERRDGSEEIAVMKKMEVGREDGREEKGGWREDRIDLCCSVCSTFCWSAFHSLLAQHNGTKENRKISEDKRSPFR
jgi:hypothetical protein